MESKTTLKYLRIAPRKVRLVADLIRGKKVDDARTILRFVPRNAAGPLAKAVQSAVASAAQKFQAEEANLYVAKIMVAEGPKLKRYRPRARGRAYPIQKKTSHVTVVLKELISRVPGNTAKQKTEERAADTARPQERVSKEKSLPRAARAHQYGMEEVAGETPRAKRDIGMKRLFRRKTV